MASGQAPAGGIAMTVGWTAAQSLATDDGERTFWRRRFSSLTGVQLRVCCVQAVSETVAAVSKGSAMPNYTFALSDGADPIEDDTGVVLTDRQDALRYARGVVRELMTGREAQTRTWRLDVYENSAECVFEIPFASLDQTQEHLAPEHRIFTEALCEREHRLSRDAVSNQRESRARLARSQGRLYLITDQGKRTIAES
jgi:hypothetical protein